MSTRHRGCLPGFPPTLEFIYGRCAEEGECMLWTGACNGYGSPIMRINKKTVVVRRLVAELSGRTIVAGRLACSRCGQQKCVANAHIALRRYDEHNAHIAKLQKDKPDYQAKRITTRRARSKLTPEKVRDIREGGGTAREAGARNGVSHQAASMIRRGVHWADQVKAASVFSWRPQ